MSLKLVDGGGGEVDVEGRAREAAVELRKPQRGGEGVVAISKIGVRHGSQRVAIAMAFNLIFIGATRTLD